MAIPAGKGVAMGDVAARYETASLPALLRHARTTYGTAMRRALEAAGYDDIPGNGLYVIGGLALSEAAGTAELVPLGKLVEELGVSKQAGGQLIDALVLRGYLDRAVDESDRRKLTVRLTERGRAAAACQGAAREALDEALLARVGAADVAGTRRSLAALIMMGMGEHGEGDA